MTEDEKLQKLAVNNWAMFVAVIGKDAMLNGKIILMRDEGKTWGQITSKLNITLGRARSAYKNKPAQNEQAKTA